jgi:hypothetical protein
MRRIGELDAHALGIRAIEDARHAFGFVEAAQRVHTFRQPVRGEHELPGRERRIHTAQQFFEIALPYFHVTSSCASTIFATVHTGKTRA